jgi:hypothetical protein
MRLPYHLFILLFLNVLVHANEESCADCDRLVRMDGQFSHYSYHHVVQGVAPGEENAFKEEVAGPSFTISVSGLPAGKYTVVIGEAETYFKTAGSRAYKV